MSYELLQFLNCFSMSLFVWGGLKYHQKEIQGSVMIKHIIHANVTKLRFTLDLLLSPKFSQLHTASHHQGLALVLHCLAEPSVGGQPTRITQQSHAN